MSTPDPARPHIRLEPVPASVNQTVRIPDPQLLWATGPSPCPPVLLRPENRARQAARPIPAGSVPPAAELRKARHEFPHVLSLFGHSIRRVGHDKPAALRPRRFRPFAPSVFRRFGPPRRIPPSADLRLRRFVRLWRTGVSAPARCERFAKPHMMADWVGRRRGRRGPRQATIDVPQRAALRRSRSFSDLLKPATPSS